MGSGSGTVAEGATHNFFLVKHIYFLKEVYIKNIKMVKEVKAFMEVIMKKTVFIV